MTGQALVQRLDMGGVKIVAYAWALEIAWTAFRDGKVFVLGAGDEVAERVATICRVGPEHRQAFIRTFTRQYKLAVDELRAGTWSIPPLSDDERLVLFYHTAEHALASRN